MLIIKKSLWRVPLFLTWADKGVFKILWLAVLFVVLSAQNGHAQQLLTFNVGGKSYSAEISWVVKYNNVEFKTQTIHALDSGKAGAFDLAVFFKFKNDSIPADGDVVWGFQFNQSGNLITPVAGEKRSRSKSQFQRFNISGTGNSDLAITPKVWQKSAAGRLEGIGQGSPFTLAFNFSDAGAAPENAGPASVPVAVSEPVKPQNTAPPAHPVSETVQRQKAQTDYAAAKNITDTIQRTRALIDFVDKYSVLEPKSELVSKAVKDIPLGISVPSNKGEGTYTYTLDYPVNLFIDSAKVKGWNWNLSKTQAGKYELVLIDLKDSVHAFTLADPGKNAPFNLPKELSPFEKIIVELVEESSDSFRLGVAGGAAPFIVFLSKSGFPVERFVIENTNTTQAFSKADCEHCETGAYTIEVYSSDFSTLLLRVEKAIHVRKTNYLLVLLLGIVGIPIAFFAFKYLLRFWRWLVYMKTLRDIRAWEEKEAREAKKRKTDD